ncbi:MAG: hypothetical protein MZW92_80880 [Comamonadaceae bacterium]|nr:hypothetical protein [Comamonadaceae bacterium]
MPGAGARARLPPDRCKGGGWAAIDGVPPVRLARRRHRDVSARRRARAVERAGAARRRRTTATGA